LTKLWAYEGHHVPEIDWFSFAICEVSSYPITPFFTFLESYEDFASFWWLFCSISMCIHKLMSVSRLSKFQAFISADYWFLLQVHIGLVRRICIFVIRLKEYSFLYLAKNIWSVFLWSTSLLWQPGPICHIIEYVTPR
jgi:hypothetical protein